MAIGNGTPSVDIKLNKQYVGWLQAPSWQTPDNCWQVWVRVVDPTAGGGWRNMGFKRRYPTEEEARAWVQSSLEASLAHLKLVLSPETED